MLEATIKRRMLLAAALIGAPTAKKDHDKGPGGGGDHWVSA
jgi:hypothetical protein